MRWLEFSFSTPHEASELLTDFLSSLGADGVQIMDAAELKALLDDPASLSYADDGFLDSLDPAVQIKAYFAEFDAGVRRNRDLDPAAVLLYDDVPKIFVPLDELEETIRGQLSQYREYLDLGDGYLGWQEVREEDWADGWKQYYQTLHLTSRLVVNPSWLPYDPAPGEIVITLDPGSAFGTGSHETTAMCAELIDQLLLPGDRVLDLGTGSGILAIIAARLGAGLVEAIDIDTLAVEVARENCRANGVDVFVHTGELQDSASPPYDLIVGNIIADVLSGIMDKVKPRLAADGLFVASGIISSKLQQVIDAADAAGLIPIIERERNDWYAIVLTAKGGKSDV